MPDQFDRHGRAAEREWGGQPSRSQQRAAAADDDPLKRGTPSKRKRGACKGPDGWHDGHDLVFVIQLERLHVHARNRQAECCWIAAWSIRNQQYEPHWGCLHSQVCSRCEHREREHWSMTRFLCPDFREQPVPEAVEIDCRRKQAEREQRAARWDSRRAVRPSVTGPQGYRKRKEKNE